MAGFCLESCFPSGWAPSSSSAGLILTFGETLYGFTWGRDRCDAFRCLDDQIRFPRWRNSARRPHVASAVLCEHPSLAALDDFSLRDSGRAFSKRFSRCDIRSSLFDCSDSVQPNVNAMKSAKNNEGKK